MGEEAAPGRRAHTEPGTIVFSHANGFPAGTYRRLFESWRDVGFRVVAVEKFGHDPAYPVTSNWPRLRDQLLDCVEEAASATWPVARPDGPTTVPPVHLVGHSLGGFLSLLAACRRPDLARSVVLLDAPVVAGWRAHGVHVAKLTGLVRRVSPGRVSRTRRHRWPDHEAALRHFAAKSVFARWDPGVLADYVRAGIEPDPAGGVRLAFDRAVETRIYDTLPHHMGPLLKRHPPACPVHFLGGTRSKEVRQVGMAMTRAITLGRIRWIEGGHLFPMERPQETSRAVLDAVTA